MNRLPLVIALTGTLACAGGAATAPSTQGRLAKAISGVALGTPRSCISPSPSRISENYGKTVLVEDRWGTIFRTELAGKCSPRAQDTLITRSYDAGMCKGDLVQVTDLQVGYPRSNCRFGEFTPYNPLR